MKCFVFLRIASFVSELFDIDPLPLDKKYCGVRDRLGAAW
jgi:hypothetical protein